MTLNCGEAVSGSISGTGESVTLTLTKTGGMFDPYLEFYNSPGARVTYEDGKIINYIYDAAGNRLTSDEWVKKMSGRGLGGM